MANHHEVVVISDSPSPPASPPPPPARSPLDSPDYDDFDFDNYFPEHAELDAIEPPLMSPVPQSAPGPSAEDDRQSRCEEAVLSCFPDICPDYLKSQAANHEWDSQALITRILDDQEKGQPYPKRPNPLKRKRQEDENDKDDEEEMRRKFEKGGPRLARKGRGYVNLYIKTAKSLLKASFPDRYSRDIDDTLKENNYQLYTTYLALDRASWSPQAGLLKVKKRWRREYPEHILRSSRQEAEMDALAAFDAARAACETEAQARDAREVEQLEEEENMTRAKAEGTIAECGCCFEERALNRMAHCNGDTVHWFCLPCAKQMAEHVVGASKYHLGCLSMDGCDGTFSRDQKELFLDDKLTTALELIEQEAVLRMAGIENLATCPFCQYAAEYPPIEENKEFRCERPDCGLVSCRLCREETHIPKTCDEAARDRGVSARRTIEEAMSAALIRKCNKCGTPFIKENGCNKMTCTRSGCRNMQCYVCSKSCDYSHFDDSTRGGKKGNCPLFDSVEDRHEAEVQAAEAEARKKVAEENPDVDGELLKINFSDKVKQDDERRKAAQGHRQGVVMGGRVFAQAPVVVAPGNVANNVLDVFGLPRWVQPDWLAARAQPAQQGQVPQGQQGVQQVQAVQHPQPRPPDVQRPPVGAPPVNPGARVAQEQRDQLQRAMAHRDPVERQNARAVNNPRQHGQQQGAAPKPFAQRHGRRGENALFADIQAQMADQQRAIEAMRAAHEAAAAQAAAQARAAAKAIGLFGNGNHRGGNHAAPDAAPQGPQVDQFGGQQQQNPQYGVGRPNAPRAQVSRPQPFSAAYAGMDPAFGFPYPQFQPGFQFPDPPGGGGWA